MMNMINLEEKATPYMKFLNACVYILLFLAALNVFNLYVYLLLLVTAIFVVTPKRVVSVNASLGWLFLFALAMVIFNPSMRKGPYEMVTAFLYPLCYFVGTGLVFSRKDRNATYKATERIILILALGTFGHYLLNWLFNRNMAIEADRSVVDVWSNSVLSATGQATFACLAIGVLSAFLFSRVGAKKKTLAVFLLVVVLLFNLILAGRTSFALLIILLSFALLHYLVAHKKARVKTILIVLLIVVLILVLYNANAFNIKRMVEMSNFHNRFVSGDTIQEIDDDSRLENKLAYLERFGDHFFGGGHIYKDFGHSAHDLYLDTYDDAGIFALIAILAYIIASLGRMLRCLRSKTISFELKQLIVCVYLVVNIQFWLEPIMRGMPWLLAFYCLIDGVVTSLLCSESEEKSLGGT